MDRRVLNSLLIFGASLLLLCINLGKPEIYILDEAKNAECAREMMVSGNYIVPYFNGQLRTDKPPLHYFFMIAGYKTFGVNAFGARFFSAMFGALTVLITFLFGRRFISEKTGWLSALVLISSLHFNLQMRMSVPDPYLIFFMTASFMTFYCFLQSRKRIWLYLMYISFGLGLLTKGPVAIGLPGLIMAVYLLLTRNFTWNNVRALLSFSGIALMLFIAVPWYWLNYQATNGVWTEGFFLKHNLQRYTGSMEGHGGFFLLPLIMVIVGLLPLGIFSISAFVSAARRRTDISLFLISIVAGIVIFFSFSGTKLPNYTTPVYPFLALMIGTILAKSDELLSPKILRICLIIYLAIALALPAGVYFGLTLDNDYHQLNYLGLTFILLPPAAALALYYLSRKRLIYTIYAIVISFCLTNLAFFTWAYPEAYARNPVSVSVSSIKNEERIVYYKMMNAAYVFNMQRVIPVLKNESELKSYFQKYPQAVLISRKEYETEIEQNTTLKLSFKMRDAFENPVTVIYR